MMATSNKRSTLTSTIMYYNHMFIVEHFLPNPHFLCCLFALQRALTNSTCWSTSRIQGRQISPRSTPSTELAVWWPSLATWMGYGGRGCTTGGQRRVETTAWLKWTTRSRSPSLASLLLTPVSTTAPFSKGTCALGMQPQKSVLLVCMGLLVFVILCCCFVCHVMHVPNQIKSYLSI